MGQTRFLIEDRVRDDLVVVLAQDVLTSQTHLASTDLTWSATARGYETYCVDGSLAVHLHVTDRRLNRAKQSDHRS